MHCPDLTQPAESRCRLPLGPSLISYRHQTHKSDNRIIGPRLIEPVMIKLTTQSYDSADLQARRRARAGRGGHRRARLQRRQLLLRRLHPEPRRKFNKDSLPLAECVRCRNWEDFAVISTKCSRYIQSPSIKTNSLPDYRKTPSASSSQTCTAGMASRRCAGRSCSRTPSTHNPKP